MVWGEHRPLVVDPEMGRCRLNKARQGKMCFSSSCRQATGCRGLHTQEVGTFYANYMSVSNTMLKIPGANMAWC